LIITQLFRRDRAAALGEQMSPGGEQRVVLATERPHRHGSDNV